MKQRGLIKFLHADIHGHMLNVCGDNNVVSTVQVIHFSDWVISTAAGFDEHSMQLSFTADENMQLVW